MASKQDITFARTATDIERKYNFGKSFSEAMNLAEQAKRQADEAYSVAVNIKGIFFFIRYSAYADGTDMTEEPQADTMYMGTCSTNVDVAPTDKNAYTWTKILGNDGVGVADMKAQYCVSSSKTEEPTSGWSDTMPVWSTGNYLWIRHIVTYTDGNSGATTALCDSSWEAVTDLDKKIDCEEIFLRLSKGNQGVYRDEQGRYYISAELVKAGIIKSKDGERVVINLDEGEVDLVGKIETKKTLVFEGGGLYQQSRVDETGIHTESYELIDGQYQLLGESHMQNGMIDMHDTSGHGTEYYSNEISFTDSVNGTRVRLANEPNAAQLELVGNYDTIGNPFMMVATGTRRYITGLTDPEYPLWAANKQYVDNLFNAKTIPAYANLDDYTSPGMYHCTWAFDAQSLINCPATDGFSLEVSGDTLHTRQIIRMYDSDLSWTRYRKTWENYQWSDWLPHSDYIVAQGTSGIWRYRKWNSGIAECWGDTPNCTTTFTQTWGSWYLHDYLFPAQSFPFTFVAVPTVLASQSHKDGYTACDFAIVSDGKTTTTATARYTPFRPATVSATTYLSISLYAVGRWK